MVPPALDPAQQDELKGAVQRPPGRPGTELANRCWANRCWKVVREFASQRFGIRLNYSACLNCPHRLGFAFKRPGKRLPRADMAKQEAFVADYAAVPEQAVQTGAKIFSVDEARFRADAELRGQ